jgi:hypothetical protein
MYCEKSSTISVDAKAYQKWQNGAKVQDAFPNLSRGDREMIQTGIHSSCFDKAFPDE